MFFDKIVNHRTVNTFLQQRPPLPRASAGGELSLNNPGNLAAHALRGNATVPLRLAAEVSRRILRAVAKIVPTWRPASLLITAQHFRGELQSESKLP